MAERENTLPAFAAAVREGADMVELDLRRTRDGGIVVLHDATLARLWGDERKVADLDWHPMHMIDSNGSLVKPALESAGYDRSVGVITAQYLKDPTDPAWNDDTGVKAWSAFMDQYFPDGDRNNNYTVLGYSVAETFVQVLKQCGDDLTRENLMRQAADLRQMDLGMLLPGITVNTSPDDYYPIKQSQMMRFNGERWERFGPILAG